MNYNRNMKYKTLVTKQVEPYRYQYSLNAPLTTLSPILSFQQDILDTNFSSTLDYAISCIKEKKVLVNGFVYPIKDSMTLQEWAPVFVLDHLLEYYKNYKQLPPVLMSVDSETQSKYSQEELIQILFQ